MRKAFLKRTADLLQKNRRRKRWRKIVISLSLVVALLTSFLLIHPAITMERKASCGQEEHTHTKECYEKKLICGKEENIKAEISETEGAEPVDEHTHSEACYEDVLICEKQEHKHGEACYPKETEEKEEKENEASEDEKAENAEARTLKAAHSDYTVEVDCPAKAGVPEDAELKVCEIKKDSDEYKDYYVKARKAVEENDDKTDITFARFFDISFEADGKEIEPEDKVSVKITYDDKVEVPESGEVKSVHFGDKTEVLKTRTNESNGKMDEVKFDAESFSVYGIVGMESDVRNTAYKLTAESNDYKVSVFYNDDAGFPENASLKVTELSENSQTYKEAREAVISEKKDVDENFDETNFGMAALDISIRDVDGSEVEPAASSQVGVKIEMKGLPDDVVADSVEVQHIKDNNNTTAETVADTGEAADGIVNVDGDTATAVADFNVNSFSTFTITWKKDNSKPSEIQVQTWINGSWQEIEGAPRDVSLSSGSAIIFSDDSSGVKKFSVGDTVYTLNFAELSDQSFKDVDRITSLKATYNNGFWKYEYTTSAGEKKNYTNGTPTLKLFYDSTNTYEKNVRVYVYVAGSGISDECLELLGIDKNTLDDNGYFPAGEIQIAPSVLNGKTGNTSGGVGLIRSNEDWNAVLSALGELNTSTFTDNDTTDQKNYTVNKNNKVGGYIQQAEGYTVDVNGNPMGSGSQHTALFYWTTSQHSYGFADQSVRYHLDLKFNTNKITFMTGKNGITSDIARDESLVDERVYITGSLIQEPRNLNIPAGYKFVGYYTDADFTTPWNGIGTPLHEDQTVYIKITPLVNVIIYYKNVSGPEAGSLSLDSEGLNPIIGEAQGSTATPNDGYEFDGWYTDEQCTRKVSDDLKYVPTKPGEGGWIDGTTFYAKFKLKTIKVSFKKTDMNGKPLSGAVFTSTIGGNSYELTSGADGLLKKGEQAVFELPISNTAYELTETTAPSGYNKLTTDVEVNVNAPGVPITAKLKETTTQYKVEGPDANGIYTVSITNSEGVELPNTGGSGTLPYTLSGLLLMCATALMYGFVLRRRRERRVHR